MNIISILTKLRLLPFAFAFLAGVLLESFWTESPVIGADLSAFNIAPLGTADHMGRNNKAINFADHFTATQLPLAPNSANVRNSEVALGNTEHFLKKQDQDRAYTIGDLNFKTADLSKVVATLRSGLNEENFDPSNLLSAHQIAGRDNAGNVFYTGYFAPVIAVNAKKGGAFQYPIYKHPRGIKGKLPSREDITGEKQALAGKGLEIAYARNPLDIYFMQVQGSGYIEYPDGKQILLSFDGSNKRSYRSIGKYMINKGYTTPDKVSINSIRKYFRNNPEQVDEILFANPSYVFFKPGKNAVQGAGQVPLTKMHSVAVDPRYIPIGSTLLAKVPVADAKGQFTHHEFRLLYAQDTGGSIKGPGRIDIFSGVGYQGKSLAGDTHHYGELWLLLPKDLGERP